MIYQIFASNFNMEKEYFDPLDVHKHTKIYEIDANSVDDAIWNFYHSKEYDDAQLDNFRKYVYYRTNSKEWIQYLCPKKY